MSVMFQLAVAGAHLTGLPLNHQLTELGARLVRTVRTAPVYSKSQLEVTCHHSNSRTAQRQRGNSDFASSFRLCVA